MKKFKTIILTTLTTVMLATPAFAVNPESPVCNRRNCDYAAQMNELPDPECIGQACELDHTGSELNPISLSYFSV